MTITMTPNADGAATSPVPGGGSAEDQHPTPNPNLVHGILSQTARSGVGRYYLAKAKQELCNVSQDVVREGEAQQAEDAATT